jgi:pimeloyl-ACP methyl ester carboxylesterase
VLIDAMGLAPIVRPKARLYFHAGPERIARWRNPVRRVVEAAVGAQVPRAEALRRELFEVRGGRPDATGAFAAMCPLVGRALTLDGELGRIGAPALVVWGARDEAFPVAVGAEAARRLPRAELRVIDAGHSPHVERPAEVLAAIEAFLERLAI